MRSVSYLGEFDARDGPSSHSRSAGEFSCRNPQGFALAPQNVSKSLPAICIHVVYPLLLALKCISVPIFPEMLKQFNRCVNSTTCQELVQPFLMQINTGISEVGGLLHDQGTSNYAA